MEIRSLRQRLEESICTNDRLREQLERRLASTGKASGTVLHWGGGLGGALHTHPIVRGGRVPCAPWALGREAQRRSPLAGLPSDVCAQAPELGLQLSGENRTLRDDNRSLRLQREHLSQGRAWPPASQG